MFYSLLVLQCMNELGGVGLSMTAIEKACIAHQYSISRYRLRSILKELQLVGAIGRNKNHFFLRLLGSNLAAADLAAAMGEAVNSSVSYQMELI